MQAQQEVLAQAAADEEQQRQAAAAAEAAELAQLEEVRFFRAHSVKKRVL
jgi:hypothetical protein